MAARPHVNLASLILATLGAVGLAASALIVAFWLSDPADMSRGSNPVTMLTWALIVIASGAALYFGLRHLRR
jgi:hypothetical protein